MAPTAPLPRSAAGVVLRRLAASDLAAFQGYRHDAELGRYQGWSATSDDEARAFLAAMSSAELLRPGVWSQIGIAEPGNAALIGDIGLLLADDGTQAEIGFTLRRESQGRGLAARAVTEAIGLVFEHTQARRVVGTTDARNLASIRLLERVGMRRVGSSSAVFRGQACVEYSYAISRPGVDAPCLPAALGLVARPIELADADEWFAFAALPDVQRHTSSTIATVDEVLAMIARCHAPDPSAPISFVLRRRADDALVGMVGFHSVSAAHRTAEITYAVQPAYWGEGVACAACAAAVDWGFSTRGWVRIQATTLQANLASQRVLAKCGFAFEGRLRNFRLVRGEPMDYLLFATVPADPADPTGFSATSHRPAARPAADPSRPSLPAD